MREIVREYSIYFRIFDRLFNREMRFERLRFESFAMCSVQKHWPSPEVLSSAGFYYASDGEMMKCFCCGATVKGWESSTQDVVQKHKYVFVWKSKIR